MLSLVLLEKPKEVSRAEIEDGLGRLIGQKSRFRSILGRHDLVAG